MDVPNDIHVLASGEKLPGKARGKCRRLHVSLVKPLTDREAVVHRLLVAATELEVEKTRLAGRVTQWRPAS